MKFRSGLVLFVEKEDEQGERGEGETGDRGAPDTDGLFGRRVYRLGPAMPMPAPVMRPPPALRLCRTIISAAWAAARRSWYR